jgi:hypothetical protein
MFTQTIDVSNVGGATEESANPLFRTVSAPSELALGAAAASWYYEGLCSKDEFTKILQTRTHAKILSRPDVMPASMMGHALKLSAMEDCVVVRVPEKTARKLERSGFIVPVERTVISHDAKVGNIKVTSCVI